ncbi:GGDEF domain-containing protein [Thalassomonas viridans]|uniref:diguanylate cyclase n=1 Tax=Thalassomonas viridans TaxID=137584 RepID=A0AAF0C9K6_9GAMM|nr:GGDEF domain-containing protein [Thalassomonas viridans]WDE07617.1 GGDEF domain-containing protein [Thalassomonas viridans]
MIAFVYRLISFCAYLNLCFSFVAAAQENSFIKGFEEFQKTESQIHYADSIRTANRALFNRLVAELKLKQGTLTVKQNLYLTYFMGYQKAIAGEIKAAIALLDKVIEQDEYQFVKYRAIITKVTIHSTSKNYTQGFLVLNNLLPELKVLEDKIIYPEALFAVASFYNRLSIYHLSQQYTQQLLDTKPSPRYVCLANMLYVESMFFLKELTMEKIDNAWVAQCQAIGENMAANFIHVIIAEFYLNENKPELALELLLQHLQSVKSTQYYLLISRFNSFIAQAYYALGNYRLAERYALMVIDKIAENHSSLSIVRASKILYQLNKDKGDLTKALSFHELYTIHDKLYNDDLNKRSFTYQIAEDNNREKNNQLIILFEQNKNLKLERTLHERTREKDQLLILSLMLIVAILAYWTYKSKLTQRKLKKMAEYDELTGILNRRCFNELADTAIKYCRQSGQPISLILFDLDEFKAINDTYGHQVGDWVLKNTIMTCQKLCRKNDIFGRFGGEEFTILLPGCDNDKAFELAESCRTVISEISTLETGYDFKISASFGICSSENGSYSLNEIVKAADEAMYHAKSSGRNRVSIYGIDMHNTAEEPCLNETVTTVE